MPLTFPLTSSLHEGTAPIREYECSTSHFSQLVNVVSFGVAPARISPLADIGSCRVVVPGKFEKWMVEVGVGDSYLFWRVKPETFKAKCHPHLTTWSPHFFKDVFVCGSPGLYHGQEFPTGKSLLPLVMKCLK